MSGMVRIDAMALDWRRCRACGALTPLGAKRSRHARGCTWRVRLDARVGCCPLCDTPTMDDQLCRRCAASPP